MIIERRLGWDGCFNVRDLGGFLTRDGGVTRHRTIVRADALDRLSRRGWSSLEAYGIRTIVDLRNDHEIGSEESRRPGTLATIRVPIDDIEDHELWQHIRDNELDGSPLYFRLFLERKKDRCAAAVRAISQARPGGVAFHCGRGRDRTGLVALLVLDLVGVKADDIASDYELSEEGVRDIDLALGEADQGSEIAAILQRKNTTARAEILDLLSSVDVEDQLRQGGLEDQDLAALRHRFVDLE